MAREKPFATEGALCEAFAEWARAEGFTVYPETAGWDMLLVAADGHQLGIEAKLSLNLKVLAQSLKGCTYSAERGPDYRAILVPESHEGVDDICAHFGIEVFTAQRAWTRKATTAWEFDRRHAYHHELHDWNPKQRCELPDYVPDVPCGVPAPRTLSPWKVGALRVLAIIEVQGFVTREDVRNCRNDPRRWCAGDGWLKPLERGRWTTGTAPRFDEQHPDIYAQILAETREKLGKQAAA
jgi:hypothetical protein